MPTFYARTLNVRLSVADSAKTFTPDPVNTLSAEGIIKKDRALDQFEGDAALGTLAETPLSVDDNGCRLGFIGEHQDWPFLMVHAKPKYPFKSTTSNDKSRRKRPVPLRLNTEVADSQDSPLSDLSSPPLSPFPTPDRSGAQANRAGKRDEAQSLQTASNIHQVDGAGDVDPSSSLTSSPRQSHLPNASDPTAPEPVPGYEYSHLSSSFGPSKPNVHGQQLSPSQPQALCLRVLPGKKAFLSAQDPDTARWDTDDLKFDVFLNGELSSSTYVSETTFRKKEKGRIVFSGSRIGRLTEKPWTLMPFTFENTEDNSDPPARKHATAQSRWNEISQCLIHAAESGGRNIDDELPAVGQYLQSLASVPMPATLPSLLTTEAKGFAVIDIIVSVGKGLKKNASNYYLTQPMSVSIRGFGSEKDSSELGSPDAQRKRELVSRDREAPRGKSKADEQIAKQPFFLHHVPRDNPGRSTRKTVVDKKESTGFQGGSDVHRSFGKLSLTGSAVTGSASTPIAPEVDQSPASAPSFRPRKGPISAPRKRTSLPISEVTAPTSPAIPRKRRASLVSPFPTTATPTGPPAFLRKSSSERTKRPRMQYHDVITTQRTLGEEMEAIVKDAEKDVKRRITRSGMEETEDNAELLMTSASPQTVKEKEVSSTQFKKPSARKASLGPPRKQPAQLLVTGTSSAPTVSSAMSAPIHPNDPSLPTEAANRFSSTTYIPPASPQNKSALQSTSNESSPDKPLIQRYRRPTNDASTTPQPINPAAPPSTPMGTPKPNSQSSIAQIVPMYQTPQQPKSTNPSPAHLNQPPASTSTPQASSTPWQAGTLNRDSIISYAGADTVRQTKAEKKGCFREDGVLVGMRFIVG
ncbi:MAG: hypothetical protein Q9218_006762 [Villophora microphyllina]